MTEKKTSERFAVKVKVAELKKLLAQVRAEYGEAADDVLLSEPTMTADFGTTVNDDFAALDDSDRVAVRDTLNVLLASSPATVEAAARAAETEAAAKAAADAAKLKSPELDLEDDPLSFKEREPTDNIPLPPLSTISPSEPVNVRQLVTSWVLVIGIERFVNRLDPTKWWKLAQFDSAFNSMSDKASIGRALFKQGKLLRRYHRAVYVPGAGEIVGPRIAQDYNVWRPSPIVPAKGDTELFNAHVNFLFDQEATRTIVLDWMAWVLQNLDRRPSVLLLIVGETTGTGKSIMCRIMEQLIGLSNSQRPKNSSLVGDFNSWAKDCKLAVFEELNQSGKLDVYNRMKEIITEPRFEVNVKGIPAYLIDSYMAGMGTSNFPDALPLDEEDRRWEIAECRVTPAERKANQAQLDAMGQVLEDAEQKFDIPRRDRARAVLGAIAYELLQRDVSAFKPGMARGTVAKKNMIGLGRRPLPRWLNQERENYPFTRTLVNVRDDILPSVPLDVMRDHTTRNPEGVIESFLRKNCNGVSIGGHRVKRHALEKRGRTIGLWALNALGEEAKSRIAKGVEPREACAADISAVYMAECEKGTADAAEDDAADAAKDFTEAADE